MLALREQRAMTAGGSRMSRTARQLTEIGKIKGERKLRASVPDAFADQMPADQAFTCVGVFESILRGKMKPLYDSSGRCSLTRDEVFAPAAADSH